MKLQLALSLLSNVQANILVLFHGFGCTPKDYGNFVEKLHQRIPDLTIVAPTIGFVDGIEEVGI